MKLLVFLGATVAYVLVSWLAVMLFLARWWAVPTDEGQQLGGLLLVALVVLIILGYVVGSVWFWFWR